MNSEIKSSTPHLEEFDPTLIPFQYRFLKDAEFKYDYGEGVHETLFSGSVGSAKSLLLAHFIVVHLLKYKGARAIICRRAMPQLRKTLWVKIKEHLRGSSLVQDVHYKLNETRLEIYFFNGSEIISHTWADGNYDKCRSYEASLIAIEELTENEEDHFYTELRARVGRLPHIKENHIVCATNPDSPSHWAYEYFIQSKLSTRHVYYSLTKENPFLPKWYVSQLAEHYDPKMALRMLEGQWVEISKEVIYHAYSHDENFKDEEYELSERHPIHVCFDFNIGEGKPLSVCFLQYIGDTCHVFNEVIVEGFRTEDALEEMSGRGLLDYNTTYKINGDATGKSRDTRSKRSDYDIIEKYFANHKNDLQYSLQVPRKNPPVRDRHNFVNAWCLNSLGERKLFVYAKAKTVDKGLRLTQFKKGSGHIEDDSKPYQHVTTALGYSIWYHVKNSNRKSFVQMDI